MTFIRKKKSQMRRVSHLYKNFSARLKQTGKKKKGSGGNEFLPIKLSSFAGLGSEKGAALFQSRSKIIIWILLVKSSNFIQN